MASLSPRWPLATFRQTPAPERSRASDSGRSSARFARLALTEAFERFSLHGVKALLTIYVLTIVIPGGLDRVSGMAALRAGMEAVTGPTSDLAFASQLYGLYGALSYLMLPLGGWLADRVISRRHAIVMGAVLMGFGHLCMTQVPLLLIGLLALAIGTGCLKGNLAAEVAMVHPHDGSRRDRAFLTYLGFLNIGAMLGPLLCGLLAQDWGWDYAFGAAAGGMSIALALFLTAPAGQSVVATRAEVENVRPDFGRVLLVVLSVTLCFCAYEQLTNMMLVWVRDRVDLTIGGFAMPPSWLAACDGAFTILLVIVGTRVWPWLARHGMEPGSVMKLMLGCLAVASGYGLLAIAAGGAPVVGRIGLGGPLLVLLLLDIGIVLAWPAALALITGAAGGGRIGLYVGLFYLHGFVANLVVGRIGGLYGTMPDAQFWLIHAAIAVAGAAAAAAIRDQPTATSIAASTSA